MRTHPKRRSFLHVIPEHCDNVSHLDEEGRLTATLWWPSGRMPLRQGTKYEIYMRRKDRESFNASLSRCIKDGTSHVLLVRSPNGALYVVQLERKREGGVVAKAWRCTRKIQCYLVASRLCRDVAPHQMAAWGTLAVVFASVMVPFAVISTLAGFVVGFVSGFGTALMLKSRSAR